MSSRALPVDDVSFAPAHDGAGANLADQRLTVDDTADGVQFTAWDLLHVTHVLITAETAECRYTLDNSAPTTTNGHVLAAAAEKTWSVALANAAKFIRTTGTSAVLHASPLRISGHH